MAPPPVPRKAPGTTADGVSLVGELQLTTLKYLDLKKVAHKFYTIKRAFRPSKESIHLANFEKLNLHFGNLFFRQLPNSGKIEHWRDLRVKGKMTF